MKSKSSIVAEVRSESFLLYPLIERYIDVICCSMPASHGGCSNWPVPLPSVCSNLCSRLSDWISKQCEYRYWAAVSESNLDTGINDLSVFVTTLDGG